MKVCIVEDDFTFRTMLTGFLKSWGYEPVAVEDGEKAWELLQRKDAPKLILIDWNIPQISGLELTERIRALNDYSPPFIILVTGNSEKESIVAGLNAGANDYIFKPCPGEVLRARINNGRRMLELQESLQFESSHDSLTGILNRRAILAVIAKELARAKRKKEFFVVGFCDIDHFKKINDVYGHLVGDEVLCGFVRIVKESLREYDTIGRWGGEEFLLILPLLTDENTLPLFERIRYLVESSPIETRAGNIQITVSIGVAMVNGEETVDEIVSTVDRNMYQAKKAGRNRIYGPEIEVRG
jgi:two-component system cell cycle response regulator